MDECNRRNPPTRRTNSLERVFYNDISDPEEENAEKNDIEVGLLDKLNGGNAYDFTNESQTETKRVEIEQALLDVQEDLSPCPRHTRIEKEDVPTGGFVNQSGSRRDFSKVDKVTDGSVLETRQCEKYKNNLTDGWVLNDNDLSCVPLVENKAGVQKYRAQTVDGQKPGGRNKTQRKRPELGSQVQMTAFKRTINQMRDVMEDKDLVPRDVYPDGNCLFAAVVDQLRIRGDFSFTSHTLRQAAVKYLKENPTTEDGTHLEMFLTDGVTWETYLLFMSKDGEWGDHIILGGLTNVMKKKIIIHNGTTGEIETILFPKTFKRVLGTDDQAFDEDSCVYVGHIRESHYVSLRPKYWRQSLRKGLTKRRLSSKATNAEDTLAKCPVRHIDFILRQTFRMGLIESCSEDSNALIPNRFETDDYVTEVFGTPICKLVPRFIQSECFGSDLSMGFQYVKEKENNVSHFQKAVYTVLQTPKDTNVVSTTASSKSFDLIAKSSEADVGQLMLTPKTRKLWRGQTTTLKDGNTYLKGFEVSFNWSSDLLNSKMPNHAAGIHHMLAFKCVWPDVADEWSRRHRKSGFLNDCTVKAIVESGCHVIPLTLDTRMSDIIDDPIYFMPFGDDCTWCYSFAAAEKSICLVLSTEQRQCFMTFKLLIDTILRDIPLPVSVVKSVFFYACENIEKSNWKSKPGQCLLILLKKTVECIKNHHVPHYFMRKKNLLRLVPEEIIDECYERLDCSRLQPMVTLYFMLDQFDFISSEIGRLVENVFDNANESTFKSTGAQTSSQPLLFVSRNYLKRLILQENYETASLVFQDILDENENSLERNGTDLLKSVLWGLNIGIPWCFAVYVDIKQKTNLALQTCEGFGTIPVTDVFGPDCIEELPDTLVPECFSISNGDLCFADKMAKVLLKTVSVKMFIKCMKFYLKRYSELAGDALIIPNRTVASDMRSSNSLDGRQNDTAAVTSLVMSTSCLGLLHGLYVSLYNFCNRAYRVEEFREMMPVFTLIAKSIDSPLSIRNIEIMRNGLNARKMVENWWR